MDLDYEFFSKIKSVNKKMTKNVNNSEEENRVSVTMMTMTMM